MSHGPYNPADAEPADSFEPPSTAHQVALDLMAFEIVGASRYFDEVVFMARPLAKRSEVLAHLADCLLAGSDSAAHWLLDMHAYAQGHG